MNRMTAILILTAGLAAVALGALTFTQNPSLTGSGANRTVSFAVSEYTDVEVSIVDVRDSAVIRHLAAGLLGANPPSPLTANQLAQTLTWDGKDDFGVTAAHPESLSVRVRAGMTPVLDNLAGEDLYSFQGNARSTPSLLLDQDGTVLILGKAAGNTFLRKYDAAGNYVKTIYPPAAGLAVDSVTAYGINVIPGGGWAPKTANVTARVITNSMLNAAEARMLSLTAQGEIVLVNGRDMQIIKKDGAFTSSASKQIITSPAAPASSGPWGPQYFTSSYDPDYLFLSGIFYGTVDMGTWLVSADTSGFWADGQVFKVHRTTGVVTSWLKLDSVPSLGADRTAKIGWGTNAIATVHGVTTDDSGHVFVCDRLHARIGVYNTGAVLQGSIPCANPDYVSVSKRTGAVYALTRGPGLLRLLKFNGRTATSAAAAINVTTSVDGWKGAPVMTVTENGNATSIYIGYGSIGFRLYADNGTSFSIIRDFSSNKSSALTFERIAVDRATERVFWMKPAYGSPGEKIFAITNWRDPVSYPVYNSSRIAMNIDNITVGPKGHIYGLGFETFDTPITRYQGDSLLAAAPYANTSGNIASCNIHYEGMNRGVAAGWQKQVCAYEEGFYLREFPDTGYTGGTGSGRALITVNSSNLGDRVKLSGVKYDPAGNFYVGIMARPADAITPAGFAADALFTGRSGSIAKYAAGTTGSVNVSPVAAVGAAKVYPQPFGPFTGDNGSLCNCTNSYFDVDPYGRLYVPNGTSAQIYVADNAGNTIVAFGEYGNTDSRGPLSGPGETVSDPAIPLSWPTSVGASEDYIYVTDAINARLVRVSMGYALDNIPGLTVHGSSTENLRLPKAFSVAAAPNPFYHTSNVRVSLPSDARIDLSVYSVDGKLVKTVVSGDYKAGSHSVTWNATDKSGKRVAPGIYVYRLTVGTKTVVKRTILAN